MKKAVVVALAICLLGASACEVDEPAEAPATAAQAESRADAAAKQLRKERVALREQRAELRKQRAELRRERAEARAAIRRERERVEAVEAAAAAAAAAPEEPAPEPAPTEDCDPNYDPCVPSYPPDLDCPDVGGPLVVTGSDPHGFDADGDGSACE